MNREDRKKLYSLLEQHARCEIMARLAPITWTEGGDYSLHMIEKMDEIRKLMFGTASLLELGFRWGLLKTINDEKERRKSKEDAARRKSLYEKTKNR